MTFNNSKLDLITHKIIGCAFEVSNILGCGFVEKVYERALVYELMIAGLNVKPQYAISVYYKEMMVGEFFADILVEKCILVELKALGTLDSTHQAQCLNYLKASGLSICLLINFGKPKVEVRRIVWNKSTDKRR
jgi:GxxExxY protein